jgi:ABC-type sugar transport system permease subunit/ABC-type glycerol-3-phosphate transport system substrate-binding protein
VKRALLALLLLACAEAPSGRAVVTLPGSDVGAEGELLRAQVARFEAANPDVEVRLLDTPDAADERHQLFVQWLAAGTPYPDVLQVDVVWTPELAAAGWLLPLDDVDLRDFFPNVVASQRYADHLYAVPWVVDIGLLYWRTDLFLRPPSTFAELDTMAARAGLPFVWQGARYEGLVTVFQEVLGGFGGSLADVDTPAGRQALEWLRGTIGRLSPRAVLTWQEEQVRFAFQNGQAAFMRNWPYAWRLMASDSQVAGRYAVAPMPRGPQGRPTAALGGQALAINARCAHPEAARALVAFLTAPEQMLERARVTGQLPPRPSLYDDPALAAAGTVPPQQALEAIRQAVPRPPVPEYTSMSQALQVHLHRALVGEEAPDAALRAAAVEMAARAHPARPTGGPAPTWLVALLVATLATGAGWTGWRWARRSDAEARQAWALVLPAVAAIALVALFPLGWAAWESLHADDLTAPGRVFVGLGNYAKAFGDSRFREALLHTAIFVAVSVPLELALGLPLALLLDMRFRGRGAARAVALLPWAIPTVVAALVWRFLFEGVPGDWFSYPRRAWVPLVLADAWQTTPFVALLLLAGLQTIDDDLYAAARVDGARAWSRFAHVTLPLLRPTLAVVLLFRTLDAFRVFGLVYVLTGGGPGTATEPVSLYAFDVMLRELNVGYGAALSVLVFACTAAIALLWVRR